MSVKFEFYEIGTVYSPPSNPEAVHLSLFPSLHAKNIIDNSIEKVMKGLQMKLKFSTEFTY